MIGSAFVARRKIKHLFASAGEAKFASEFLELARDISVMRAVQPLGVWNHLARALSGRAPTHHTQTEQRGQLTLGDEPEG